MTLELDSCQYGSIALAWDNLRGNTAGLGLAGNQALPGLSALTDNIHGVPRSTINKFLQRHATDFTDFLFLHSPVKANWFSGLPSGIL